MDTRYELIALFPGSLAESEFPEKAAALRAFLEAQGVQNTTEDIRGKQRLTYPMGSEHFAYFNRYIFDLEPKQAPELQNKLRLSGLVLRAMVTMYNPDQDKKIKRYMPTQEVAPVAIGGSERRGTVLVQVQKTNADKAVDVGALEKKIDEILEADLAI